MKIYLYNMDKCFAASWDNWSIVDEEGWLECGYELWVVEGLEVRRIK